MAVAARLRLIHPFPSLLNGAATLVIALVAGAEPVVAVRLGLAMTALQFSIGALNDVADAPLDRGRRPIKPVAEGLVSLPLARAIAATSALVGLALAAAFGLVLAAVAALGLACGYVYDVRLSRTMVAWLPLSIALPLLPIFAWLGATGHVPTELLALVPIAALAGGGLAVGNSLVDVDADRQRRVPSIAVRLGRPAAARLHALLLAVAALLAVIALPRSSSPVAGALVVLGEAVLGLGVAALFRAGPPGRAGLARPGWQVEAIGAALIGVGWLVALAGSGLGAG
jgi:4-hydroxybenzoate polyprenyltransferase